jgi:hypothetical protein
MAQLQPALAECGYDTVPALSRNRSNTKPDRTATNQFYAVRSGFVCFLNVIEPVAVPVPFQNGKKNWTEPDLQTLLLGFDYVIALQFHDSIPHAAN